MTTISLVLAGLALFGVILILVMVTRLYRILSALQISASRTENAIAAQASRTESLSAIIAGQFGIADAAPHLVTCLNDERSAVAKAAAEALAKIGKPAVEPLLAALKNRKVPSTAAVEVLKRLDMDMDLASFLSLPTTLHSQLLFALDGVPLGSAELRRLCASDSPDLLGFVLSHENADTTVLQSVAQKPRLSSDIQEKLALHQLVDESIISQLSSTDALGAIAAHDSMRDSVKAAARSRMQELLEQRRKEREAEERRREREAAEASYEEEDDYGRGRNCAGCGGC